MPTLSPHHRATRGFAARLFAPVLALLLGAVVAPGVHALPDDREQPIHITADKAVRDEKRGMTVYSGNVHMRQGSMELEADSLTIFHDAENADQIIARGAPAKMRQRPEIEAELVHAHAGIITYFKLEDRVLLERDARVEQEGDLVTGDSIDYLIGQQLITAESDKSEGGEKVFVVLQPTVQPAQPDTSAQPDEPGDLDAVNPDAEGATQDQTSGTPQGE